MQGTQKHPDYWRNPMPENLARKILSEGHYEVVVAKGSAYCAGRARGAWDANDEAAYGAYRSAEETAKLRSAQKHAGGVR